MKCIILAGGIGNTLWPLSRKNYPKQFLNICEGRSLLQDTIVRNLPFADEFIIVTNESYKEIMESQLKAFQGLRYRIIYESRNCGTFAAVSLALRFICRLPFHLRVCIFSLLLVYPVCCKSA